MAWGEMRIAHDHLEGFVAQELRNGPQGLPVHGQVGGEGVTEVVEAKIEDSGPSAGIGKGFFIIFPGLAVFIAEDLGRFQVIESALHFRDFQGNLIKGDLPGCRCFRFIPEIDEVVDYLVPLEGEELAPA